MDLKSNSSHDYNRHISIGMNPNPMYIDVIT